MMKWLPKSGSSRPVWADKECSRRTGRGKGEASDHGVAGLARTVERGEQIANQRIQPAHAGVVVGHELPLFGRINAEVWQ
jgi:hypothetical protein